MSNPLAIAAVTATLRNLLTQLADVPELNDATVTTQPLDRARTNGNTANQLNLFLYQALPNAALRNMDMPRQVKPGETAMPPLALNLYYLLTAYGRDNDMQEPFSHHLLGRAMSILHDHAVLGPDEIRAALPNNDLFAQVERVRLTLQPLSLEELSKLWAGFETQFRLSVAYEAAVVLIESTQSTRAPLPVLTRGPGDRGVTAQADLTPPFPGIDGVLPPNRQASARLGDTLTITGHHLDGAPAVVRFTTLRLTDPVDLAPQIGGTPERMTVQLPNAPADWPAGFYTVSVAIGAGGDARATNELPLALAPRITSPLPVSVARVDGEASVTLTASPEVRPEQRASLLVGDREVVAEPHPAQTNQLTFVIREATAGAFFLRLRVDGVDTLLIDKTVSPPVFDQTQRVTIT